MAVKDFSTATCPYCLTLKNFLKEHNIEFEDIDVSQDEKVRDEMIKKSGQMGVPVVEIGKDIVVGFNKKIITRLLKISE